MVKQWGSPEPGPGREAPAYRSQGLKQAVEGGVPEATQAGEGGQEPQEEVGQGDEGHAAQRPAEAQLRCSACSTRPGPRAQQGATSLLLP